MKREDAIKILEAYNFHLDELDKAMQENDQDEVAIHVTAIKLMESDYAKATEIVKKLEAAN